MANANITKLDAGNFSREVEGADMPVLVDFWAPWCGPCRAVAPVLEQLAGKYAGKVKISKVNVDEEPTLASRFRIMSIPSLLLFKDGRVLQQMVGLRSAQELENMLERAL